VIRAVAKGALQLAFGALPGGAHAYRRLTRERLGTYATHVDKLRRVWPGYVHVWHAWAGLRLDGARVWVHEAGETPFSPLAAFLLTGSAGVVTNGEGRLLDRYLARAVNGALDLARDLPTTPERVRQVEALRWETSVARAVASLGGEAHEHVDSARVPLASDSVDLCHSGGELEHLPPDELDAFLVECRRVLRPGGVASHVFDHRDHLHHTDNSVPFLAHLAWPAPVYRVLFGHAIGYHNRLTPTEVAARFAAAGFERIAVRRMIYPDRRYVDDDAAARAGAPGLSRALLAPRFRAISEEDLRTAACHYLYRKPHS
jgi:SAM-dependent methyltransferase